MTRRKTYQKGSVKLQNGKWTLRIREFIHPSGSWQMRRFNLGKFKDRKDALKAADPNIRRFTERNNAEPQKLFEKVTFREFVEPHWKPYTVKKKLQVSTLYQRERILGTHILPFFGSKMMRDIQPSDISKFLRERIDEEYADNTLQNFYAILRVIFDLAEQNDVIEKSPVRSKLHRPEKGKVEKPTLSAEQIRVVMSHLSDEQERLLVLLLAVTGLRVGEGLALRWMDFNAQGCELSVNHTLYHGKLKVPKTRGSKTTVKLAPQIAGRLLNHRNQSSFQLETDFIFCRVAGCPLPYNTLRLHLYKSMDKAGINRVKGKYGHHIFRHSAGTLLYERSRDLKLVQGTLRHSDISTTSDVYVHLTDDVLSEGTTILADEILGNCDPSVTQKSKMVS